jgi:hypothetical protein
LGEEIKMKIKEIKMREKFDVISCPTFDIRLSNALEIFNRKNMTLKSEQQEKIAIFLKVIFCF